MGNQDTKTTVKYVHAASNRIEWVVENMHLDGQTQNEADQLQNAEMQGIEQDLVTGNKRRNRCRVICCSAVT